MELDREELLRQAIARNSGAVLSLPSAGMLRSYKTRLLSEGDGGIWTESVGGEAPLIDRLIADGTPAGIAIRHQTTKLIFTSPILRREAKHAINQAQAIEAILLAFPTQIKSVQRRAAYRVCVPLDCGIAARVWRIAERAVLRDRPPAGSELSVQLRDLSVEGIGLLCLARGDEPAKLDPNERLRVVVRCADDEQILLSGRACFIESLPNGTLRAGIHFERGEDDLAARHASARLSALVGQLQREEARRHHFGL